MTGILLTKSSTFIIGPVATILGYIMDAIFNLFYVIFNFFATSIGNNSSLPVINALIENKEMTIYGYTGMIGLCIILFTIVVYLLLMPLTIKQQKFSKLSAKMNPEIQAVQAKYKGKKDNESMMAMNEETKLIYAKYGVSPTGSCMQLLIQMPILFALYQVINNMPAYVTKMRYAFSPLVEKLQTIDAVSIFTTEDHFKTASVYVSKIGEGATTVDPNLTIDILNKASTQDWEFLKTSIAALEKSDTTLSGLSSIVTNTQDVVTGFNTFLGLNIGNSPQTIISSAWETKSWLLIIGALMIPLLSAATQWISIKLTPQAAQNNAGTDQQNSMMNSMKTMNNIMPIMSAVFCFSLPAGMGLYWIAGAVVRTIQQIIINRHIDKIDLDEVVRKNIEKNNAKRAKAGLPPQTVVSNSKVNTKTISKTTPVIEEKSKEDKDAQLKKATDFYSKNTKPGSIASKANMVKQYNEKNNK